MKTLKELKALIEEAQASIEKKNQEYLTIKAARPVKKEIKGEMEVEVEKEEDEEEDDDMEEMKAMIDYCFNEMGYLYSYARSVQESVYKVQGELYDALYQHSEGHLPPIQGAEKLQKALKTLGLDGDYNVEPRTIFASKLDSKGNKVVEITYNK